MRFLPTRIHGIIDYITGTFLIFVPAIFGLPYNKIEGLIIVILGIAAIVYSFFTDYELGVKKIISMPVHLNLDFLSGIILASSPWIFGFYGQAYLPHVLLGVFEMLASLITKKTTSAIFKK